MTSRRGFSGVTPLRRKLRSMDYLTSRGVMVEIRAGAEAIERDMIGGAPIDEGDLARSIAHKLGRDGFTAVIGPGADNATIMKSGLGDVASKFTKGGELTSVTIRNKEARVNLFKALWAEFGTKDHGGTSARPFIQPAYDANKDQISRRTKAAVIKALKDAARG